jgi:ribonuclease BN (tRNA processing enzyme)
LRIFVLGCGGSRGKNSRPTAFLVDNKLLLDCGSVTEVLNPKDCARIDNILITHSHIDHIGDLPFLAELTFDLRAAPVNVYGIKETIDSISSHILNGHIWPNFSKIPNLKESKLSYNTLSPLQKKSIGGYSVLPIPVNHTIPTVGYLIDDGKKAFAFTGDTYVTDSFWQNIQRSERLRALIIETSFPDSLEEVAKITGHLTPSLLREEIKKLNRNDVEIYVSHMKPYYRKELVKELKSLSKKSPLTLLEDGMEIRI